MRPLRLFLASIAFLAFVCLGCAGEREPAVERIADPNPGPVRIDEWRIEGQRDGARTRTTSSWRLADGRTLEVVLVFAYDPQPVLAEGEWSSQDSAGTVRAESVRFVGGQGEGPSVGGRFVLLENGAPQYRLDLPLTRIRSEAPRP